MPYTNGFISGPYTKIWVGKTEAPDVWAPDVPYQLPWTCTQSGNIHCEATWLTELKPQVFLFYFEGTPTVEIAMNGCYNSNLLQLMFILIRSPLGDNNPV